VRYDCLRIVDDQEQRALTGSPQQPRTGQSGAPAARGRATSAAPGPGREIELKLLVAPADLHRIMDLPPVAVCATGEVRKVRQQTSYYDTPDLDLARRGLALRVRRQDGRRIQAVKTMSSGSVGDAAAVAVRREWEWEITGDGPDLESLRQGELAAIIPADCLDRITPVFSTDIVRTIRHLRRESGAEVELALDQGQVAAMPAGSASTHRAVSEVELELKTGRLADLFEAAAEIHRHVPLRLSVVSKADLGFALLTGRRAESRPARPLALSPFTTVAEAFRHMARNGLAQLLDNEPAFQAGSDPEALREMAAAVRRLDAALGLFKQVMDDPAVATLKAELRRIARPLEDARAWDRVAERGIGPTAWRTAGSRRLPAAVAGARREARLAALETLAAPRWTGWLLDFAVWVERSDWAAAPLFDDPMQAMAPDLLRTRLAKCAGAAAKLDRKGGGTAWRKLWRRVQRLRYALDFCRTVCPQEQYRPLLAAVEELRAIAKQAADADQTLSALDALSETADRQLLKEIRAVADGMEVARAKAVKELPSAWAAVARAAPADPATD